MRRTAAVVVSLALSATLVACSGSDDDEDPAAAPSTGTSGQAPARPVAVGLSSDSLPDAITIGVIASLTSRPGEGSQWRASAEGAQVAAYRFRQAGADVEVVAVDDRGTTDGAVDAVQDLIDQGVAGIVVASSGPHLGDALAKAAIAQVPVLLPYDAVDVADLPEVGVWLTGPDAATQDDAVRRALEATGATDPILVDAGGPDVAGVTGEPVQFRSEQRSRVLVDKVKAARKAGSDAVVVSGPAALQALAVRALQGGAIDLPVVLTADALSPVLATDLVAEGGSLAADLITVGPDTGDAAALQSSERGRSMAAYFAALAGAAGDDTVTDFFDAQPFATVADDADPRSHDAVVALVRGVDAAGSTDPAAVTQALGGLSLTAADGLVGPDLDFSSSTAVAADDVVPLRATPQDPGVRPVVAQATPHLFWFALPAS